MNPHLSLCESCCYIQLLTSRSHLVRESRYWSLTLPLETLLLSSVLFPIVMIHLPLRAILTPALHHSRCVYGLEATF